MQHQRRILDGGQQRRIEELARARGVTCTGCGSGDLSSGEEAHRTLNHGARVELQCTNEAAHPGGAGSVQGFAISPEEAQRIGLG